jgi:hypothetical protein
MKSADNFLARVISKVTEQIHGRKAGFLLGAGTSYLNGQGYPLAHDIWPVIRPYMSVDDQQRIEKQFEAGCANLEDALDGLDIHPNQEFSLRHSVSRAIVESFKHADPPSFFHQKFVKGLSSRPESKIHVFTLNYDPMVESAADQECTLLVDGFSGTLNCYFKPTCFEEYHGIPVCRRNRRMAIQMRGTINLYKLHGSLGWYLDADKIVRRKDKHFDAPKDWLPVMIPPQRRKASDTGYTPYAVLWSEFRGLLANDASRLLNRLICVGYAMGDGHVNAIIQAGLARPHFTLVILTKRLADEVFDRWSNCANTIIVTENACSFYGERGPGTAKEWSFEWLSEEVSRHVR